VVDRTVLQREPVRLNATVPLAASSPAREAITAPVMVIHEHEDVYDAAAKMAAARCRRPPVVNTAGELVGVVGIDDMVGAFSHRTEPRPLAQPALKAAKAPSASNGLPLGVAIVGLLGEGRRWWWRAARAPLEPGL